MKIPRLKLKVENTIRWRVDFDAEGNAIRESNAKLVKWSDGSLSLHLGSEIFDVYKQPLQVNDSKKIMYDNNKKVSTPLNPSVQ